MLNAPELHPVARSDRQRTLVIFRVVVETAEEVFLSGVVGDEEATTTPMRAVAGGRWEISVELAPGRYHYCYIAILPGDGAAGRRAVLLRPRAYVDVATGTAGDISRN